MKLTEEQITIIKEAYQGGLTNPTSIVSLLYSKGLDGSLNFTELKKSVKKELNLFDVYKSVAKVEIGETPVTFD